MDNLTGKYNLKTFMFKVKCLDHVPYRVGWLLVTISAECRLTVNWVLIEYIANNVSSTCMLEVQYAYLKYALFNLL